MPSRFLWHVAKCEERYLIVDRPERRCVVEHMTATPIGINPILTVLHYYNMDIYSLLPILLRSLAGEYPRHLFPLEVNATRHQTERLAWTTAPVDGMQGM